MALVNRLFVYGTLAPGRVNEHWLKPLAGSWQEAWVCGVLYEQGWGAAIGYPGLVLKPEGKKVSGMVFTSEQLTQRWPALDEFEGKGYQRVITDVTLNNGTSTLAHVYILSESPPAK